jgi:amino acid permease
MSDSKQMQAEASLELQHDVREPEVMDPDSRVKRALKTRHLSMMALAGIIGPGLLVGSGGALYSGGPASLLIGFGVIGIVAFSIMQSLGELSTLYPSGGAFTKLAGTRLSEWPSAGTNLSSGLQYLPTNTTPSRLFSYSGVIKCLYEVTS